jgi:anti-sigma-K factor RskA
MHDMTCDEVHDLVPAFVLGALEPDAMDGVRKHIATCPEAHLEIQRLGAVVPALAASVAPARPSPALGPRIMAAARAEAATAARAEAATAGRAQAATAGPVAEGASTERPIVFPGPLREPAQQPESARRGLAERLGLGRLFERPAWGVAGVAAVLAIVVLGAWNLQLQRQVADLGAYRTAVLDVLDTAARPGGEVAVLTAGNGGAAAGISAVGADGHLVVAMRNLAPTTGTTVYEAWLIGANGEPVAAGSFRVDASGTGTMAAQVSPVGPGLRVALTLEPAPGATAPTLPIIAQGQAQPATG